MAAGKPTAVHFSLIFFVMLSVILGVMFYLNLTELQETRAEFNSKQAEYQQTENLNRTLDDRIQALVGIIGHEFEEIGENGGGPQTVIGAAQAELNTVGGLADQNYTAAVDKLKTDLQNVTAERDELTEDRGELRADFANFEQQAEQKVATNQQARADAEQDKQQLIASKEEEVRAKQTQIDQLRQENNQLKGDLQRERTGRNKDVNRLEGRISDLNKVVEHLNEKLDQATKVSFEQPDGEIVWVNSLSDTVWINVGEADNLNERTTFSVYSKGHHGVARGQEDIKGRIEVTRIIDAHTAEARVLEDDLHQPMAKGDPIYTPLWSPGRQENFSFVGIIDLDNDGSSDRQRLHSIVTNAGGAIDNEVLDDGKRIRYTDFPDDWQEYQQGDPGIGADTKFLVVGKMPDLASASKESEIERIEQIHAHRKQMVQEAREQGVRVVNLNDFLSWIGYTPQRRLYVPGLNNRPYNLKAGARSTTTNEDVGDRSSTGQVSGAYGRSKRLKPRSSTGSTSKLFGNGY